MPYHLNSLAIFTTSLILTMIKLRKSCCLACGNLKAASIPFSSGNIPGFTLIFFCFGRRDIFCLRLSEENYPKVNLVPDVPDISILCRRTEEVPRTSIKSEFLPRKKKTLLCCGRNSISYQSRYHIQIKN